MYPAITQSKAAQKAGISQAALSQIEKQGSRPQI
ncbi:helix-turn-helix transcriptional regulator [Neisseria cinerea]|nr:helix-turn-helix transcriptional regulator [Neisseria cinerea]